MTGEEAQMVADREKHLLDCVEALRIEVATLKMERETTTALMLARDKENAGLALKVKDLRWTIERIEEEVKAEGGLVCWTDGGGNKAPSGWARNPYINWGRYKRSVEFAFQEGHVWGAGGTPHRTLGEALTALWKRLAQLPEEKS